jgi:hypothetical protein
MQLGAKTFTLIEFSTTCKISGSNSGPYCCSINTTISSNFLAKCTYHENHWTNIGQQNVPVTTTQPTVEAALTCAYCQHVGHEFKNCPFVDDKLKKIDENFFQTSLQLVALSTLATHVGVHVQQIQIQPSLVTNPIMVMTCSQAPW